MPKLRLIQISFLIIFASLLSACSKSGPAMVATANPHASRAAALMLEKGGTAIDAAIAAQMVLTLVEPQSSGIGGGAFLLYWQNDQNKLTTFDGRETAPQNAGEGLFLDKNGAPIPWPVASIGGRPVGTPGVIALAWKAHGQYGRLPWRDLFQPAIKLAKDGFAVTPRLSKAIAKSQDALKSDAQARELYFLPHTMAPLPVGFMLKNSAFAQSLTLIAEKGPDGFYKGPLAAAMVKAVKNHQSNPGHLSMDDLASYEAIERTAVCGPYRAYKVCGMGPPTSGGLTSLMILGILENYNIAALEVGSATAMHLFTQASRLAYADRDVYMADDDFVEVPVKGLLNKSYLRSRAKLINPVEDMGKAAPGSPSGSEKALMKTAGVKQREYGTSHLSIVDDQGNAVSMTTSVERGFGSHIVVGGFVLNSQLTDFSFVPVKNGVKVANRVEAGKRPRSSMTPTMIFNSDGSLYATLGSPGGSRIIEFVTRAVIGLIDWDLSMQASFDLGNVHNRNRITDLEKGTNAEAFATQFKAMGHKVRIGKITSGLHGIRITKNGFDGGADTRREGMVIEVGK